MTARALAGILAFALLAVARYGVPAGVEDEMWLGAATLIGIPLCVLPIRGRCRGLAARRGHLGAEIGVILAFGSFLTGPGNAAGQVSSAANYAAGMYDDSRPLLIGTAAGNQDLPVSGTATLLNISGTCGNVEDVQIAFGAASGTTATYLSTFQVIVDGATVGQSDLRTLFCYAGTEDASQSVSSSESAWTSENMAADIHGRKRRSFIFDWMAWIVGKPRHVDVAARRRLYIPFYKSIRINVINASSSDYAVLWSQVQYRVGPIPATAYGASSRRAHFHLVFASTTNLPQYANFTLLPTVTGSGVVDSVQLCETVPEPEAHSLAGFPFAIVDSGTTTFGSEDAIFGKPNANVGPPPSCEAASWGIPIYRLCHGVYAVDCYRFFEKDPMPFNRSVSFVFPNGTSAFPDPHEAPGLINATADTIYYTSE